MNIKPTGCFKNKSYQQINFNRNRKQKDIFFATPMIVNDYTPKPNVQCANKLILSTTGTTKTTDCVQIILSPPTYK